MLATLGIVEACWGREALPCRLRRRFCGQSVLEWVVRRMTDCARLDGVIVLACGAGEHTFVSELVPPDVPVFVSDAPTALDRFLGALESYRAESVVRVPADHPFVDPELIDRLATTARAHPGCDYVSYCLRDGRPAVLSPVGLYAEWFRVSALRRAARAVHRPADRQQFTRYLCSHPDRFQIRLIPAPPGVDRDDVRLLVDDEQDWDLALAIVDALGPERLDWRGIASLLDHQPALRRQMAALNRVRQGG